MRVLVTGAAGFVGRHLVGELARSGHDTVACDARFARPVTGASANVALDLRDRKAVIDAVAEWRPESCVHLGAISFVPAATDVAEVFAVNVLGTANVLEAFRRHGRDARILAVSTGRVYAVPADDHPVAETEPLQPSTTYGASKAAADLLTLGYARRHGLCAMTARPNNHAGPGQSPSFVVAALAAQIAAAPKKPDRAGLVAGNLNSERHFLDVRDVARAYRLLLEKGRSGEAYNISSGQRVSIGSVLNAMCEMAGVIPSVRRDPERERPTDRSPNLDTGKIRRDAGWEPEIPWNQTLRDVLDSQ